MGMSTYVVGFRPADDKWKKMKAVWDACKDAGTEPPKDVLKFFDDEYPNDKPGQEINLGKAAEEWGDGDRSGYEVDIEKLPKGVRYIRFYNSW